MLNSLAEHYGFDVDTPWGKAIESSPKGDLFGSGDTEISFNYVNDRGDVISVSTALKVSSTTWSDAIETPIRRW